MAKKEETKSVIENPEVIAEKLEGFEAWVENNTKTVIALVAVLLVAVGGFFGFRWWVDNQNQVAQQEMFQAIRYFEADSLNLALKGTANVAGFENIIEEYSLTPAANLAHFYAGAIELKQGNYSLAVFYLKEFKADDILVQARAYALLGDAYMEQNQYQDAADSYHKAAGHDPNKFFKGTICYFEADSLNLALKGTANVAGFENIIEEYSLTPAANLAHFYAGAIELKQGNYSLAVFYLKEFKADDILVKARALALLGDAYMEQNQYQDAADSYHKAAGHDPNKFFTPGYLMKEALAYEKLNQNDKAIAAYDRIINEFWDAQEVTNAKKLKARLETAS